MKLSAKLFLMVIMAITLSLFMVPVVHANGDGTGIVGSPHDFSGETWNTREEICRTCHVPHDHQRAVYPTGLLWNHEVTSTVFTPYTFIDGTTTGQPNGVSKLCLGCHDGSVAIDEYDGNTTGTIYIGGGDIVPGLNNTGSLARTHPLSVVYEYDAADLDGMNDPASTPMGTSGMIQDVLQDGTTVQCSSCHDVHNNESMANTHLLRVAQKASQGTASGLCLTCHNK